MLVYDKIKELCEKNGISIIDMPDKFMQMLSEYRRVTALEGITGAFVFGGDKPLADTTIIRIIEAGASRACVQRIRQHDFRHSHASCLISMGVPITMVSARLGHSNINETLKTYAHFLPQDRGA